MRNSLKQLLLAFTVVGMLVGGSGLAVADYGSSPVIDTSTTDDTTSTSEVQAGTVLGENNTYEGNSSLNKTFQWISNSNDTQIEVNKKGSAYVAYSDDAPTTVVWNATDGDGHFNSTMAHSALLDVDHKIGENVTMKAVTTNNTSAASPATNNETFYIEWDNSTTTKHFATTDVDGVTYESNALSVAGFNLTAGPLGADYSSLEATDRKINGSNTDVYVTFSDSNISEDFSEAAEDASAAEKMSGLSWTRNLVLIQDADGNTRLAPVYYDEAPDSVESSDTYAVYHDDGSIGGSDGVAINLGDSYEDSDEVTVTAKGSVGLATNIQQTVMQSVGL